MERHDDIGYVIQVLICLNPFRTSATLTDTLINTRCNNKTWRPIAFVRIAIDGNKSVTGDNGVLLVMYPQMKIGLLLTTVGLNCSLKLRYSYATQKSMVTAKM